MSEALKVIVGDCREALRQVESSSIQCCITSPPYFGLRDYGKGGQIGLEETPEAFIQTMVEVFREVRRTLKDDGTLWLNLGDSYSGSGRGPAGNICKKNDEQNMSNRPVYKGLPPKNLIGIPWRVALALQADGWILRQDIIWDKPNPMPESVNDRCTKSHEYIFLMTKSPRYYYDNEAIKEPAQNWGKRDRSNMRGGTTDPHLKHHGLKGSQDEENPLRNKRSVWTVPTKAYSGAHFATFPEDLIKPCIMASTRAGDTIVDPFGGSGTTGRVSIELGRKSVLIELNEEYAEMIEQRTTTTMGLPLS